LPFEGVQLLPERETDSFYRSELNVRGLIGAATRELSGNHLVIFCLAIGAGMRRAEIDRLLWRNVDLQRGTVTIVHTDAHVLKTEGSAGVLTLESAFVDVLKRHALTSSGKFVLMGPEMIRDEVRYRWYRCAADFRAVNVWLKGNGIVDEKGVHTLRKEFGSHIAEAGGILAASVALRHSTSLQQSHGELHSFRPRTSSPPT
jgi:integrase